MNQKNGKKKVILVLGLFTLLGSVAVVPRVLIKKPVKYQSVEGVVGGVPVTLTQPEDTLFKIEKEMLLLKQKKDGDTIFRLANFSYTEKAYNDTNVLSVRTITGIKIK